MWYLWPPQELRLSEGRAEEAGAEEREAAEGAGAREEGAEQREAAGGEQTEGAGAAQAERAEGREHVHVQQGEGVGRYVKG